VAVVGYFIPIVIVVVVMVQLLRLESSFLSKSISFLSSSSSTSSSSTATGSTNKKTGNKIDDTVPHLIECLDQCVHFNRPQGCYNSEGVPLRGDNNRWTDQWKKVTDNNTLSSLSLLLLDESFYYNNKTNTTTTHKNNNSDNDGFINHGEQTTTILTGDIVVVLMIHTPQRNINHIFHDDFWSILSYFSQPSTLQNRKHLDDSIATVNVTLVHDYSSPWLTSLVEIIVQAYPWWNVAPPLPSYDNRWICTSLLKKSQKLYVNGYIRDMHNYQLPELIRIRNDLRSVAHQKVANDNNIWTKLFDDANKTTATTTTTRTAESLLEAKAATTIKKEWIVIYTREDTPTRNIHDTQAIVDALDTDRYNVHIQRSMPTHFYEQVAMFGKADLFIAPNGGWTPNVLWMKDTACLIELHLYKTDSWLLMFGLSSLFPPTHVQTITGDYHNSSIYGPRLQMRNRNGGDDEIQGSMVIVDIIQQLKQHSPDCQRFLRKVK
jgi:hypothetical protein